MNAAIQFYVPFWIYMMTKKKAYQVYDYALRVGFLVRPKKCKGCGEEPEETLHGHHYKGYDHPLDVQWLCAKCHCHAHKGTLPPYRLGVERDHGAISGALTALNAVARQFPSLPAGEMARASAGIDPKLFEPIDEPLEAGRVSMHEFYANREKSVASSPEGADHE